MRLGVLGWRIAPPVSGLPVRVCGAVILLCIAAGASTRLSTDLGDLQDRTPNYVIWTLAAGVAYAAACALTILRPPRRIAFILLLALAMRAVTFIPPPLLSTDLYRYVWDGQVQNAGINPYRYLPADPALASLRDTATGPAAIYSNINRADYAPTIYPPVAQAIFAVTARVWPGVWGMKATMLAFDLLAIGTVLALLHAAELPRSRVLFYAWNPLVVWEFAGGGHVDAAAVGFSALALYAAIRMRPAWAGVALACAVLCKLLPVALFPALWRPRTWRMPLAAAGVIAAGYAAYAGAGWRVLGFLPGYAAEEGLGGTGVLLLRLWPGTLPGWAMRAYGLAALAGLGALALLMLRRPATPRAMAADALWFTVAIMAALSPHYSWYLSALAVPAAITPRLTALWLMAAAPLLYLDPYHERVLWPALVFLPALLTLAIDLSRRPLPEVPDVRDDHRTV